MQETFARVLRKPRLLRSEDDLGYLLRVLRNTFFSHAPHGGAATADDAASRRPRPDRGPLGAVQPEARIESAELYAAISALPDDFRDALIAIDVVGLSYREAARGAEGPRGDDHDPAAPRPPARRERAHPGRPPVVTPSPAQPSPAQPSPAGSARLGSAVIAGEPRRRPSRPRPPAGQHRCRNPAGGEHARVVVAAPRDNRPVALCQRPQLDPVHRRDVRRRRREAGVPTIVYAICLPSQL